MRKPRRVGRQRRLAAVATAADPGVVGSFTSAVAAGTVAFSSSLAHADTSWLLVVAVAPAAASTAR